MTFEAERALRSVAGHALGTARKLYHRIAD